MVKAKSRGSIRRATPQVQSLSDSMKRSSRDKVRLAFAAARPEQTATRANGRRIVRTALCGRQWFAFLHCVAGHAGSAQCQRGCAHDVIPTAWESACRCRAAAPAPWPAKPSASENRSAPLTRHGRAGLGFQSGDKGSVLAAPCSSGSVHAGDGRGAWPWHRICTEDSTS